MLYARCDNKHTHHSLPFELVYIHTAVPTTIPLPPTNLTCQARGERNFHVFYYLLSGNDNLAERAELQLTSPHDYVYLGGGLTISSHLISLISLFSLLSLLSSLSSLSTPSLSLSLPLHLSPSTALGSSK